MTTPTIPPHLDALARGMFESYTEDAGGLTWDKKPIPGWDDPRMTEAVRQHWRAAARFALGFLTTTSE